jgi:hypothetical protein
MSGFASKIGSESMLPYRPLANAYGVGSYSRPTTQSANARKLYGAVDSARELNK